MQKTIMAISMAAVMVFAGSTFAGWNGGDIHNHNNDYSITNNDNSTTNAPVANGGNAKAGAIGIGIGGQGGAGGNATIEKGAVNNSNRNTNMNTNVNSNKNENKNTNTNLNCNTNKNTNVQGQGQVQGQAQGQGQAQKNELTIIEAETKREHISGSAQYGMIKRYADKYNYGAGFQSVRKMTHFRNEFSYESAVKVYGKTWGEGKCKTIGVSYNGRHENNPTERVQVFNIEELKRIPVFFDTIGYLTIKATDVDVDSFTVMMRGVTATAIAQGDAFIVMGEGASFKPEASGWGIGTFVAGGQVADHGNRGDATTAGGGTGYSKTSAELGTLPWMQIQIIKFSK